MSTLARLAILLVSMLSLFGGAPTTTGAITWHNTGSTAFTATAGANTLTSTFTPWSCGGATMTGDSPTGSTSSAIYSIRGTMSFSSCSLSGIATGVDCAYTFTGATQTGSQVTGDVDMTCGWYQFNTKICHVAGNVHAIYTNPVAGVGTLTLTTGGKLVMSNPASGTCPLGNGDLAHLSELTIRTTSANPPVITRTA